MSKQIKARFTVERISKPYGQISTMPVSEAVRKIIGETVGAWSEYAATDRLSQGLRIETPHARYVAPSQT